jgi:hypothetical protein
MLILNCEAQTHALQIESTRAVYALSLDNTRNRIAKMVSSIPES